MENEFLLVKCLHCLFEWKCKSRAGRIMHTGAKSCDCLFNTPHPKAMRLHKRRTDCSESHEACLELMQKFSSKQDYKNFELIPKCKESSHSEKEANVDTGTMSKKKASKQSNCHEQLAEDNSTVIASNVTLEDISYKEIRKSDK